MGVGLHSLEIDVINRDIQFFVSQREQVILARDNWRNNPELSASLTEKIALLNQQIGMYQRELQLREQAAQFTPSASSSSPSGAAFVNSRQVAVNPHQDQIMSFAQAVPMYLQQGYSAEQIIEWLFNQMCTLNLSLDEKKQILLGLLQYGTVGQRGAELIWAGLQNHAAPLIEFQEGSTEPSNIERPKSTGNQEYLDKIVGEIYIAAWECMDREEILQRVFNNMFSLNLTSSQNADILACLNRHGLLDQAEVQRISNTLKHYTNDQRAQHSDYLWLESKSSPIRSEARAKKSSKDETSKILAFLGDNLVPIFKCQDMTRGEQIRACALYSCKLLHDLNSVHDCETKKSAISFMARGEYITKEEEQEILRFLDANYEAFSEEDTKQLEDEFYRYRTIVEFKEEIEKYSKEDRAGAFDILMTKLGRTQEQKEAVLKKLVEKNVLTKEQAEEILQKQKNRPSTPWAELPEDIRKGAEAWLRSAVCARVAS